MSVKTTVSERYAGGAQEREEALCCPVDYSTELLEILPEEIIEKDYGCGDPSRYVRSGDHVLDLGSGGGKICYMAAQIVGEKGSVTGVDMTDEMLALAQKYRDDMAKKLGNHRVDFKKGFIQDLALDVNAMNQWLSKNPVTTVDSFQALEVWKKEQKSKTPLVANQSMDLVISNCVLNLVDREDRTQLLSEIFRVLKPGGRVAISDIICDEDVPKSLQDDAELWSGCISGAFGEKEFIDAFVAAGFVGVTYDKWDAKPWRVVQDIEFRSVTLTAIKPAKTALHDGGHAVIYRGPFEQVSDDLGNYFPRGERIAVSKRTFDLLSSEGYSESFIAIAPKDDQNNGCFSLAAGTKRPVAQTKGGNMLGVNTKSEGCC